MPKQKILLKGIPASPGTGEGRVVVVKNRKDLKKVKKGNVLVVVMTDPSMTPVLLKVAAVIADKGGVTSHAAIISRELGIPCVVGTEVYGRLATEVLKDGMEVIVDGTRGEVYNKNMLRKHILLKGIAANPGEVKGRVRIIRSLEDAERLKEKEILVASETTPEYTGAILKAAAIVTDFGGRRSHPAIAARDMGIPGVVGTFKATQVLKDGMEVIVDGEKGIVFSKTS